jgi:hypothetical protein
VPVEGDPYAHTTDRNRIPQSAIDSSGCLDQARDDRGHDWESPIRPEVP